MDDSHLFTSISDFSSDAQASFPSLLETPSPRRCPGPSSSAWLLGYHHSLPSSPSCSISFFIIKLSSTIIYSFVQTKDWESSLVPHAPLYSGTKRFHFYLLPISQISSLSPSSDLPPSGLATCFAQVKAATLYMISWDPSDHLPGHSLPVTRVIIQKCKSDVGPLP